MRKLKLLSLLAALVCATSMWAQYNETEWFFTGYTNVQTFDLDGFGATHDGADGIAITTNYDAHGYTSGSLGYFQPSDPDRGVKTDDYVFTANYGSFVRIEIRGITGEKAINPGVTGWSIEGSKLVWTGYSHKVNFGGTAMGFSSIYWEYDPYPAWLHSGDEWNDITKTLTVNSDVPDGYYYPNTTIEHVIIKSNVTSIGSSAFSDCSHLTSVTIRATSLSTYGANAFDNAHSSLKIYVPEEYVDTYKTGWPAYADKIEAGLPSWVLDGDEWDGDTKTLTIHTNPANNAYGSNTGINHLVIGAEVTNISFHAFHFCSILDISCEDNSQLVSISSEAFYKNENLLTVTIPASVTSIGADAFWGCTAVTDVYCYPNAEDLTWNDDYCDDFKAGRATVCHVKPSQLEDYNTYIYSKVRATFVGDLDAPSDFVINANEDPQHDGVFYSTFYHSGADYTLPAGVEAFKASISGDALNLTKVAVSGQSIPAGNAVILKSNLQDYTLAVSAATSSTYASNSLQGVDAETSIASAVTGTCYVLSGTQANGVGFYLYESPNQLQAHKAFVDLGESQAPPRRLRFVFNEENTATGIDQMVNGKCENGKWIENGQFFILRNGVRYNAQGQIVK